MKNFAETGHCRSSVHCETCRDREGGRAWRLRLARTFALPAGAPDFACPHDRPWGWRPPDRGLGDTIERGLDVLGIGPVVKRAMERLSGRPCGCGRRRDALNRAFPYRR